MILKIILAFVGILFLLAALGSIGVYFDVAHSATDISHTPSVDSSISTFKGTATSLGAFAIFALLGFGSLWLASKVD
jgi:hypothetical protein